jgi:hypothetical protein
MKGTKKKEMGKKGIRKIKKREESVTCMERNGRELKEDKRRKKKERKI